jgi:peptide/nickel transport system permease protein
LKSSQSPWGAALRALAQDRSAVVGAVVLVLLALLAATAPFVAPYDCLASQGVLNAKNLPPSLDYPFGTDQFSRDVLSRVICGSRVSLSIAFLSVLLAAAVGTVFGAVAGYLGGWLDALMMRTVDALLAIPRVLLVIAVATLWDGVGIAGLIWLLGLTGWFGVSRLVRALVVSAREDEFVTAVRGLGASDTRILAYHVLPQVIAPVLVAATLSVGNVIVIEAGLSYLGVGVKMPDASWGNIISNGLGDGNFTSTWWVWLFPGIALMVTVLAVNLVVDGLRQALSARQLPAR